MYLHFTLIATERSKFSVNQKHEHGTQSHSVIIKCHSVIMQSHSVIMKHHAHSVIMGGSMKRLNEKVGGEVHKCSPPYGAYTP